MPDDPSSSIDRERLVVTGAAPSVSGSVSVHNGVIVVIHQAFGPTGESLMDPEVTFDGFPAVRLLVRAGAQEGMVHLSPIHGDRRKRGMDQLAVGTKLELLCPVSREPLQRIGKVVDDGIAEYYAIHLTPKLSEGSSVYVSDVWGHYHSRVIDDHELISYWAAVEGDAE